jgi:hypothetical protein
MILLNENSLIETVGNIFDATNGSTEMLKKDRAQAAAWIAGRVSDKSGYFDLPAPTASDLSGKAKSLMGEPIVTKVAIKHIYGEEALRALISLGIDDKKVTAAIAKARNSISERIADNWKATGMYCCGHCSISYFRSVLGDVFDRKEHRLEKAVAALKAHRLGDGRWSRFPFYYSLLALSEMDFRQATDELRYAAPSLERAAKIFRDDTFGKRKKLLAEKIFSKI